MQHKFFKAAAGLAAVALTASQAAALDITIDYGTNTFFLGNATARNAIEAAANDLENAITTTLGAQADTVTGVAIDPPGTAEVIIDGSASFNNPSVDGNIQMLDNITLLPDEFRVYVGTRNLNADSTTPEFRTLGRGGHAGIGFGFDAGGFTESGIRAAGEDAEAQADANFGRVADGPVVRTVSTALDFGSFTVPIEFDVGPSLGALAFDAPADDGEPFGFQFDHTAPVGAGQIDFYSVALHEILHTLGIGTYASWDANVSGTDWLGEAVQELLGQDDDNDLIAPGHIMENVIGTTFAGDLQEVVMSPSISTGERRFLTDVDLAFLTDIGWTTVAVPEPSLAIGLIGMGTLTLLGRRRSAA